MLAAKEHGLGSTVSSSLEIPPSPSSMDRNGQEGTTVVRSAIIP